MPIVFGFLCYASVTKRFDITIFQSILASVALLPWILKLFSKYLSEFEVGAKGISAKIKETVRNKDEIEKPTVEVFVNEKPSEKTASPFEVYMPEAKKILRTLWKQQVEHFGAEDLRRWGFSVGKGASDYSEFILGITQLLMEHLIVLKDDDFVFLSNEGIDFCIKYNKEISAYPSYYSSFSGR